MITFPLTIPTATGFKSITVTPAPFVALTESPWTGDQQVQRNQGQQWMADVMLPIMDPDDAAEWEAFFMLLNGREGTFLLGHPGRAATRGVGTGTPLVKGASQAGQALITDGWTPSTTNILKKGDFVQLGIGASSRLYRQLVDLDSDGSGNATLTLWPRITLANVPADNATIYVANTVGLFRLNENTVPFAMNNALQSEFSFKATSVV